jgi:LysM repeat protein
MGIAQSHAGFMAANGVSHYGVGGSTPYQRAIAAGYPLAGDLTQGGLFSENITAGGNKSVADAVLEWQGDAPHLGTMLSPSLTEIGAGVVVIDGYYYYVIDCGRSTESGLPQEIPPSLQDQISTIPSKPVVVNTLVPNTPEADGNTYHVVKEGETLWLIAVSYGIKVDQIKSYNPFINETNIYPGQRIYIPANLRPSSTPEPATMTPTVSPTVVITAIAIPTATEMILSSDQAKSPTATKGLFSSDTTSLIIFVAVSIIAIFFTIAFVMTLKRMQE